MRLVLMAAAFLLLPSPSSASQTVSISDATGRTPVVVAGATPEDIAVKLATAGLAPDPKPKSEPSAEEVCETLNAAADAHDLPTPFFIRLIWQESRFDRKAVSPVGAQGVAQFMPATASAMGLEDPFDPIAALPMSAQLLRTLRNQFGNLGLAAAAYNAGEARVSRWLERGGFLPLETENFVLDIMGEPAESFSVPGYAGTVPPLDPKRAFQQACRDLPAMQSETVAMSSVTLKPWGIQVAGNFRRSAAIRQWQRVKGRFGALLADYEPVVSRVRSGRGRSGVYAVRIGVDDRANADIICQQLRGAGGSCIVLRNR